MIWYDERIEVIIPGTIDSPGLAVRCTRIAETPKIVKKVVLLNDARSIVYKRQRIRDIFLTSAISEEIKRQD